MNNCIVLHLFARKLAYWNQCKSRETSPDASASAEKHSRKKETGGLCDIQGPPFAFRLWFLYSFCPAAQMSPEISLRARFSVFTLQAITRVAISFPPAEMLSVSPATFSVNENAVPII